MHTTLSSGTDEQIRVIAGPFALSAYHGNIHRAAAREKERYAMHSVALIPEVPGLVATNGRLMAMLPIRPIHEDGSVGDFGTGFSTKPKEKPPILLPLELFKGFPRKLEGGQTHIELTVIERDGERFAVRRDCPYGNQYQFQIPKELRSGQYPEYEQILQEMERMVKRQKTTATAHFDATLLQDICKAIGATGDGMALVSIFDPKKGALVQHYDREAEGPKGWEGAGIIMPMSF